MVELIPFLLFLLEWDKQHADPPVLTRYERVFLDEEECRAAGALLTIEARAQAAADDLSREYEYSCHPMPPREEFEAMLERETAGQSGGTGE